MLNALLHIIAPVYLLLAAGALAARRGLFSEEGFDAQLKFAQGIALPCVLALAVARIDIATAFQPRLLAAFYIPSILCFLIAILISRRYFDRTPGEAVAVGFGALFSNALLLGASVVERAYGADALLANYVIVAVHAPINYLIGIGLMEWSRADGRALWPTLRMIARSLFRNALILGIACGFLINLSGVALWEPLEDALNMIARAGFPLALFALGGVLTRYRVHEGLGETTVIVGLSLLLHPLLVWMLGSGPLALDTDLLRGAVMTAAMAPGINAYLFANLYGRATRTASSAILLGTGLSIFSASLWLMVLGL